MKSLGAVLRWLFISFLCLAGAWFLAQPVFAAHLVPGSVPQTRPLQPLPEEGIAPNLKESVQSENSILPQNGEPAPAGQNSGSNPSGAEQTGQADAQVAGNSSAGGTQDLWVLAIILVLAGVLGGFGFRRYRRGLHI